MKEDKNALYFNRILNCLLSGETYTILQIAANVGLSEKTVRTKIDQMNRWLTQHDMGRIEKKQGTGIWLEMDERQWKNLQAYLDRGQSLDSAVQPDDRRKQVIGKLLKLKSGQTTTLAQLADSLYLSAPTIGGLLREVSPWFEERSLKIASIRSKGVCLVGDEYNFRIAIKDYIIELMPEVMEALLASYAPGIDISRIRRIVLEAENAWRVELADTSFKMVWIMACLSMARRRLGDKAVFSTREENIEHYNEYSFAESIYQRIEQAYEIKISDDDTVLLAVLLLSARKLKNFSSIQDTDYARQYDRDLGKFVRLVIETIDSVLDIDLSEDQLLYESLLLHMRSAIFRMKYSTAVGDNISKYVKSEYKQTFLATWSTSNLFEEYYDVQVTEDELAGIALYIQAAIIRRKKGKPLTALLISEGGMAASQLNIERLKYSISEITEIRAVSYHDFKLRQYQDVDVIINTSGNEIGDDRVVSVGERLNDQGIEAIRQKVNQIFYFRKKPEFHFNNLCHQLFEVDLFLLRPKVRDKDQLITMMVKKLEDKGDVTPAYLQSVFDRERATTTSIGRGIAIPHGNMAEVNESRIVVAILEEPIVWHDDMVDVVFLLAVKMNTKFEIRRTKQFYKDFLQLTDNDENMEAIKRMGSTLDIYQYFIK
ncbi:MAG: PTS transporter subunit EIIA [Hungatella sp.]|nr:PTS transporter subunit EIIA [Hungatella sp.]